jgi:hypothetical protein
VDIEMMAREVQDDQRRQCRGRKDRIVAAEHAPRSPGVAPVHKLKKTFHDHAFLVKTEVFQHDQLRGLVCYEN